MKLVENVSKAKVCGIRPGERGEVDEQNPGVVAALKGGLLAEPNLAAEEKVRVQEDELSSMRERFNARWEERERAVAEEIGVRARRVEELEAKVAELEKKLADTEPKAPAQGGRQGRTG